MSRPVRKVVPLAEWPTLDRQAYQTGFLAPLTNPVFVRARRWSPSQRQKAERGYGRWLRFLQDSGELEPGTLPSARVSESRLKAFLGHLEHDGLAPQSIATIASGMADAMTLMEPTGDHEMVRELRRDLIRAARPTRDKRARLVGPMVLEELALDLIEAGSAVGRPLSRDEAISLRDGVILWLILETKVRVGNLLAFEPDKHLTWLPEGPELVFPRRVAKQKRDEEYPIPETLGMAIEDYAERARPVLLAHRPQKYCGRPTSFWLSDDGCPLTPALVHRLCTKRTMARCGKPINPHLFRDIAVNYLLMEHPEYLHHASNILRHANPRTTHEHYMANRRLAGGRQLDQILDGHRTRSDPVEDFEEPY